MSRPPLGCGKLLDLCPISSRLKTVLKGLEGGEELRKGRSNAKKWKKGKKKTKELWAEKATEGAWCCPALGPRAWSEHHPKNKS